MRLFIKDFKVGYEVKDAFLVQQVELLYTKNEQPYLKFKLKDKTASISAFLWSNKANRLFEEYLSDIIAGCAVKIAGKVTEYSGDLFVHLESIEKTSIFDKSDLLLSVDSEAILTEIKSYLDQLQNKDLCRLRDLFLADNIFIQGWLKAPAAKRRHGSYQGGLIEHVLDMLHILDSVYPILNGSGSYNQDLLIMGIFVHDLGKIETFDVETCDYTRIGRLEGHIILGFNLLQSFVKKIPDFDLILLEQLNHILLSHHGSFEKGSVVKPQTLEAIVIHYIDELSANLRDVKEAMAKVKPECEPKFDKMFDRYLYNFSGNKEERKIKFRKA